jgi:hypothetical protein
MTVVHTLNAAVPLLARASVDLTHVNDVQAARADIERVVTELERKPGAAAAAAVGAAVPLANSISLLRAIARRLEQIENPDVMAARDFIVQATLLADRREADGER